MDTGSSQLALEDAEEAIARTFTFQKRAKAETPEQAKQHIYYGESEWNRTQEANETLAPQRPMVILGPEGFIYRAMSISVQDVQVARGTMALIVIDNVQDASSHKESFRDFWGWVSLMIDELVEDIRPDAHFRFDTQLIIPPWRPGITERASDDFFECCFLLNYSTDGGG